MRVTSLDHLVLTVADIGETVAFYTRVLGMQAERFQSADGTTRMALAFGVQKINLHQAGAEFEPRAAMPGPGSADLCFLTETPLADWQVHFVAHGLEVEEGPVARTGATGPILSLYLRDPDGNLIEVSTPHS
ncbi:VOC family protein [Aliiroseovarius sp.]|uniref:VOC family protein n=1 Tax=Aliiroseovarius sp. TaxID=1872442 RepID=UPI00261954A6|nr:VOC family protein [Aliiroseovarius sp.]